MRKSDILQRFKTDQFAITIYKSTLGKGFQGTVYKTTLKKNGKTKDVATKRIKKTKFEHDPHIGEMIQLGSNLGISPHLYGIFYTKDYVYLVMDKLDGFWNSLWPHSMTKNDIQQLANIFDIMIKNKIYNVDGDYGYKIINGKRKWYIVDWGVSKRCDTHGQVVEEFRDYFHPSIGMAITPMLQMVRAQMKESLKEKKKEKTSLQIAMLWAKQRKLKRRSKRKSKRRSKRKSKRKKK